MTRTFTLEGNMILRILGGSFAFVAFLMSGCSNAPTGYEPTLEYPPREDAIVLRAPYATPTALHAPGTRDRVIREYHTQPGGKVVDPNAVDADVRSAMAINLKQQFGTPAQPLLAGQNSEQLAAGSRLYRTQCAHCHGLTGHGRGPTGMFLEPPPRDFRTGHYKSAAGTARPIEANLKRVIRQGVPGTQMQAYDLLSTEEVDAIIAYVLHLAQRGECETKAMLAADDPEIGLTAAEVPSFLVSEQKRIAQLWQQSWGQPLPTATPPQDADSVRRGYSLSQSVGCFQCHPNRRGQDGFRYDVWGNVIRVPDLAEAQWKWGREPGDLAARVRHGISAVNMPANPALNDRQVNDIVAFLMVIARPDVLPDDVRAELYQP